MAVFLKNETRSATVQITLRSLFNDAQLYTKTLSPRKTVEISPSDLKKSSKDLDPGAVLLDVKTPKNDLVWKGAIPISENLIPIKINADTKKVVYGTHPLPSTVPPAWVSWSAPLGCCLVFLVVVLIILLVLKK